MTEEKWTIRSTQNIVEHPYVSVSFQEIELPDGRVIDDWPIIRTKNYVNAFVLDQFGRAMLLEGYKHGLGRSNWQVLGGYLEEGEDPLQAARRELIEETGYQSDEWQYLGSYVVDANRYVGTGHFFLAKNARQVAQPDHDDLERFVVRWVSPDDFREALFDGRVGIISYAVNISLALLALQESANPDSP